MIPKLKMFMECHCYQVWWGIASPDLKSKLLGVLSFPPRAKTAVIIENEVGPGFSSDEYTIAMRSLIEDGSVGYENGWFWRNP